MMDLLITMTVLNFILVRSMVRVNRRVTAVARERDRQAHCRRR